MIKAVHNEKCTSIKGIKNNLYNNQGFNNVFNF